MLVRELKKSWLVEKKNKVSHKSVKSVFECKLKATCRHQGRRIKMLGETDLVLHVLLR